MGSITSIRLVLLLVLCISGHTTLAKTYIIYGTFDSVEIKKTILYSNPYDTVLFKKGIYYVHNLLITQPVTLIGEQNAILDGSGKYEILIISSKNVTILKLQFQNSGYSSLNDHASIKVIDASEITIENNSILNAFFAIHISNSSHCTVRNNRIEGSAKIEQLNGNAIHAWKCHHLLIEKNVVSKHRDGIYLEFVTHSRIVYNHSSLQQRYGLHFMFSNDDVYENNVLVNNGAGVAVMYSKKVSMKNNQFQDNLGASSYGLLLKDITDSEILHNLFTGNTKGIQMEGSNRIVVNQNQLEDNGWGITIQANCMDNMVTKNNFINNTFDVATNGNVVLNTFDQNYWDNYTGYDLNKDGMGDIPHRPLSLMSVLMEQNPSVMILMKSFIIQLFDRLEKVIPTLTPEQFIDLHPIIKSYDFH